jgi:hypothetical protein
LDPVYRMKNKDKDIVVGLHRLLTGLAQDKTHAFSADKRRDLAMLIGVVSKLPNVIVEDLMTLSFSYVDTDKKEVGAGFDLNDMEQAGMMERLIPRGMNESGILRRG